MGSAVECRRVDPEVTLVVLNPVPSFEELYDAQVEFVWRTLRRLGVPEAALDDATQEVFMVVHRRLPEFQARSSPKTWLFAIAHHVAQTERRSRRRHATEPLPELLASADSLSPHTASVLKQELQRFYLLLEQMDDERRAVFVMVEMEEMSAPEIAEALQVNLNTVYTRLRAARAQFNEAIGRQQASESRSAPWTK